VREAGGAGDREEERIASRIADDGLGAGDSVSGLPLRASELRAARPAFLAPPTRIELTWWVVFAG
jgi:hypothetical protein